MAQYLMDLLAERERPRVLDHRIDQQNKVRMRRMVETGADCTAFAEDWGTQTHALSRPRGLR